ARKVLEYSLLSLKNSAQEVAQKNVWLFSENEKLRDNIRTLKAELVRLEEDKMKWIVQNASIDDINAEEQELIFFEKNASSLTNDVSKMVREQQNLEKNLDAKRSKEDEVLQEIAKVNKYIVDVQQKIDNLNIKKSKGAEDNIKEQLIEQIETSGDEIEALQRQLTKVTNNNIRPLSEAEEVSKKRSLLKQQLLIIEDELKIVLEEEDKIQKEISNVSEERESRKEELLKEIKALNDQKDSLKSILSIAKDKLKASNLNLDSGEEGERQLIENLVAIKNEKKMLLKKVSDFEKQIQEIKNK
ncbi:MAG: hypothetical protein KKD07_02795, partial [Candidatus Omnitrophica bacterium]|nr:hypothetical protein [Candidatus Omnitrophota bacterium]